MTHLLRLKLVKYIFFILIYIMSPFTPGPKCTSSIASASIIIGLQETLHTFQKSACLGEEINIQCPESTVIDVVFGRFGALASGSSEEAQCNLMRSQNHLQHQYVRRHTTTLDLTPTSTWSPTSVNSPRTTTAPSATSYTLSNDYLDDGREITVDGTLHGDESYYNNVIHQRQHRHKHQFHLNRPHVNNSGVKLNVKSRTRRNYYDDDQRSLNSFDDDCQGDVDVKDALESMCRSKQKCSFSLDIEELSSIKVCNSTHNSIYSNLRFLEVAFRCGPSTRSQHLICEGDTFTAECGKGQRMVIFDAYFGKLDERPPLISVGPLTISCDRFANKIYNRRKELAVINKYSKTSNGTIVDGQGNSVDPWFDLTTCRTTPIKAPVMTHCHGQKWCKFDVTKQALWQADLLKNCKKESFMSPPSSKHEMNHLKIEYTCADKSIFRTVPVNITTVNGGHRIIGQDGRPRPTPTIVIGESTPTVPAQDYPNTVSLTPMSTTAIRATRRRPTTVKSIIPPETVKMNASSGDSEGEDDDGSDDDSSEDSDESYTPTEPTTSRDEIIYLAGPKEENAPSMGVDPSSTDTSDGREHSTGGDGQGVMRTSATSSPPSGTSIIDASSNLANCTTPPVMTQGVSETTSGNSILTLPVNNLFAAYSFIVRNLEKFILYFLIAFLASLLAVLSVLSCRLYCSKRHIIREQEKELFTPSPIDVIIDDGEDDLNDHSHSLLSPSPGARYAHHHHHHHHQQQHQSPHQQQQQHPRYNSPATVDGNGTGASDPSLRSHSGNSQGGTSFAGGLPGGASTSEAERSPLVGSSPNSTHRPNGSRPSSRSSKFISPLARVYFERHCQECTLDHPMASKFGHDSGTSSGPGDDNDSSTGNGSPDGCNGDREDSDNRPIGFFGHRPTPTPVAPATTIATMETDHSGDSDSMVLDHESPHHRLSHQPLESNLDLDDEPVFIDESSDLPTSASIAGTSHCGTTSFMTPLILNRHHHHHTTSTLGPSMSSAPLSKSPFTSPPPCTTESTPLLTTIESAPPPSKPRVVHSFSFVHHPHHLNHHQHQDPNYYNYQQTNM